MRGRSSLLPQPVAFWLLAFLLGSLLAAASAPSPLYGIYQAAWGFSPITLTGIYAVYAFAALGALLVTGRVSDHVGRKRVTAIGLVIQVAGMLTFVVASGVEGLYAARTLQGVGTGMATGALTAWLLDLQPADRPRLASIVGGIALIAGLGLGGFVSSVLAEYGPDPLHLVFWVLTGVYAVGIAAVLLAPDVVVGRHGWLSAIHPRVAVPPSARPEFAAAAPSVVATWAVAGLYLSLGPSLALALAQSDNRVVGGLVILALLGSASVASFASQRAEPRTMVVRGSAVVVVGVAITLVALVAGSVVLLYAGSVVAGLGFGPAFSGVFRAVAPLAPPDRRGALLAAFYVLVYLSFSVPTIAAGAGATLFGLRATTLAYGAIAMLLAAITAIAMARTLPGSPTRAGS